MREAERRWGLSRGDLHHLLSGNRSAGREVAIRLRNAIGLPIEHWSHEPVIPFKVPQKKGDAS
jgi:plasmid maintenance system antidote protein VapI